MTISSLAKRKFHFKKSSHAAALNTAMILVMMVLTVIVLVAYLDANAFIPSLHLPLIILLIGMAVVTYYIKIPPPYVKVVYGEIKVRKHILGGWKSAALRNLQAVEMRENIIYMTFSDGRSGELEIKLDALNTNDARELQELLSSITSG